jgi:hypothetical protein
MCTLLQCNVNHWKNTSIIVVYLQVERRRYEWMNHCARYHDLDGIGANCQDRITSCMSQAIYLPRSKIGLVDLTGQPLHGIRVSGLRVKRITIRSSEAYEDPARLLICTLIL